MAIVSKGYDGSVDEVAWASLAQFLGTDYAVKDAPDWKVTAVVGLDRTARVAIGTGYGHGVRDVSDATVDVQLPTIASGTRWDLIAARRNWQPVGGTTTFVSVTGTSAQQIPAGRLVTPGVQDEQPLALVQLTAGQTTPSAVIDLRQWPGKVLTVPATALLPVSPPIGTVVCRGHRRDRRVLNGAGSPVWLVEQPAQRRFEVIRTVLDSFAANTTGTYASLTVMDAPAGEYDITGTAVANASATAAGTLRIVAGSTVWSLRCDVDVLPRPFTASRRYVHNGGDLPIATELAIGNSNGFSYPGSSVSATWLGPLL